MAGKNKEKERGKPRQQCHRSEEKQRVSTGDNIKPCREVKQDKEWKVSLMNNYTINNLSERHLTGVVRVNPDCRELRLKSWGSDDDELLQYTDVKRKDADTGDMGKKKEYTGNAEPQEQRNNSTWSQLVPSPRSPWIGLNITLPERPPLNLVVISSTSVLCFATVHFS